MSIFRMWESSSFHSRRPLAVIQITNKDALHDVIIAMLEVRIHSLKKAEQFNLWKNTHWGLAKS